MSEPDGTPLGSVAPAGNRFHESIVGSPVNAVKQVP